MPIFFSPHADLILSVLSCTLVLAGATCFAIASDKSLVRPIPAWKFLAWALLILAAREWLGIIGLSDPTFISWYPVAAIMQTAASILTLLAARAESPSTSSRAKATQLAITLLLLALMGVLIEPYFRYHQIVQDRQALISATRFFLTKASMFLVALILFYCTLRSPNPPPRSGIVFLGVFCLHALLIFICRPPGLPATMGSVLPLHTYLNTALFLLRIVTATVMAILAWNAYSRAIGVTRQIRWWPIAFLLFLICLGAAFIALSVRNYQRLIEANILGSVKSAAAAINPAALLAAADNPGSANNPDTANEIFGRARSLDYYHGYARYTFQIDAVAAPDRSRNTATPIIDLVDHPDSGAWLNEYVQAADAKTLFAETPIFFDRNVHRFEPFIATAPIKGENGAILGVAAATIPTSDVALDVYLFKRPLLLFLPLAFSVLLLLLSRQQRAWLIGHSTSRADAIRQGALGNELTAVVITRGNIVIDCNQRFPDIVGRKRDDIIGADMNDIFETVSAAQAVPGPGMPQNTVAASSMENVAIRRADGDIVHLLTYGRPLTDNPGERHYIWEAVDITSQREMENRLRENHDSLQMIIDTIPDAVFLKDTVDGKIRHANSAFIEHLCVSPDTPIIGKTTGELSPRLAEVSDKYDVICREMGGSTLVYENSYPISGRLRHFEVTKTLAGDGSVIIGTAHDLTQHMEDQEAIKKERHFLLQLLNTLPMSVCYIDRDEVIRLCDLDFCREAGVDDPEKLIGRRYQDVAPFGPVYLSEDARMLKQGDGYSDVDFELTKDGVTRNFKVRRIIMRDADGEVQGLVKAFWDTTDFVAASHAAKKAERAKAAFLANMSHELRTPMNGIVGMADLIIDHEGTTPVQRLYAETIIKSAKTLQMVMDEVMDIATVDDATRRLTLASAPFPLLTLTEEAAQIVSCIIEAWGVKLYLAYDFRLHSIYHGDARHIKQILVQLLTHCSRLTGDRRLKLEVADTGRERVAFRAVFMPSREIAPEDIEALFKKPGVGAAAAANTGSLGIFDDRIGLPLLWQLIEAMHGSLEVKSIVGGVVCEIVLPLNRDAPGGTPPLIPPDLSQMRVLVATSDSVRYTAARAALEFAKARVERSTDCAGAKRMIEEALAGDAPYDMLALDCGVAEEKEVRDFLVELQTSATCGNPPVMLIVTSRQVQGLSSLAGNIKTLLLPPTLPSELWYKSELIFVGGEKPSSSEAASRGTTTVLVRRHSTRIARLVKIPARVLLVEDNTVNQMVAMGILKRIGCEATLAKNGKEAVEMVQAAETAFDLVLMDCMMPVMDGYEATSRIRMHERTDSSVRRNTIVALTANTVTGDKEKCLAAGMDGYITKPVTMELLRDVVAKYCPNLVTMVDQAEET